MITIQNEKQIAEKIKSKYEVGNKEPSKLEKLKTLDKKVKTPPTVFAYIFGILSSLILGTGMCFAMKVLGDIMWLGIVIGVVGIVLMSVTYTIYKAMLNKRREKYSQEIINLSSEILNEKEI